MQKTSSLPPFETLEGAPTNPLVILCDHASNYIPPHLNGLGIPATELERHIAYDIGAAPLTRVLAERLHAHAVLSHFSRLLIDPNRGECDPTLIMRLSDGAIIEGNRHIDEKERTWRIEAFYRPYNNEISRVLASVCARGLTPVVLSIHTFTDSWKGIERPWHTGVLWARDERVARPLIEYLRQDPVLVVGDNEPYTGALEHDTMNRHCTVNGYPHVLIEVRQDLLRDTAGVEEWAARLAPFFLRFTAGK